MLAVMKGTYALKLFKDLNLKYLQEIFSLSASGFQKRAQYQLFPYRPAASKGPTLPALTHRYY